MATAAIYAKKGFNGLLWALSGFEASRLVNSEPGHNTDNSEKIMESLDNIVSEINIVKNEEKNMHEQFSNYKITMFFIILMLIGIVGYKVYSVLTKRVAQNVTNNVMFRNNDRNQNV